MHSSSTNGGPFRALARLALHRPRLILIVCALILVGAGVVFGMNREEKTTLVLVTHNLELAEKTERILQMKGGKLINERVTTTA